MANNRYYYYDAETCSFVELKPKRTRLYAQVSGILVSAVIMALVITWGIDRLYQSPEEVALRQENEALQTQLSNASERMSDFSDKLSQLELRDRELYRGLLQVDPISEDVRRVGVGGVDEFQDFSRFSASTSALLGETSQQLNQLELKVGLQNTSYRELADLASDHEDWLAQMPAILPSDGPVVSGYGMRNHPILGYRRMHYGIDILVPTGTPIIAPGDGVIKERGVSGSFGNFLRVEHPLTGYVTLYAHLSRIPNHIRVGTKVSRGEKIAYSGSTGLSKSPHLHYEVHDKDGNAVNPIFFFAPSMTPQKYKELLAASEASEVSLD